MRSAMDRSNQLHPAHAHAHAHAHVRCRTLAQQAWWRLHLKLFLALVWVALTAGCSGEKPPQGNAPAAAPSTAPRQKAADHATALPAEPAGPVAPIAPQVITLVTYNVLADAVRDDLRWPALFKLFAANKPDILCLQEVRPEFLQALEAEPWFKDVYHVPQLAGADALINGNVICTRAPIDSVQAIEHRSMQGRVSMLVKVHWNGRSLAIATCHLESMLEDGPIRADQMDAVFPQLATSDDAIFAGDFNFGDGEQPDSAHIDKAYTDLWTALHPKDAGFTWNKEQSDMAKAGSFREEHSRRIDRVFLRSKDGFYQAGKIEIIGDQPIQAGDKSLFPSDHFGLAAKIALKPE